MAKSSRNRPTKASAADTPAGDDRETIVYIKGSRAARDFVADLAEKTGIPRTTIYRIAFRDWCERNGHGTPPGR